MKKITVFILCGGKSTRMESEKGLVLFQGKPFIEHIIEAVLPISDQIQLVANGIEYDYLPYKKISDIESGKGPLGGIYTALYHTDTDTNMILSCDIPLISTELLQDLLEKHDEDVSVTILSSESRMHPLIGMYSKSNLPLIKDFMTKGNLKLRNFISSVPHQIITFDESQSIYLTNINSLDELNDLNANLNSIL